MGLLILRLTLETNKIDKQIYIFSMFIISFRIFKQFYSKLITMQMFSMAAMILHFKLLTFCRREETARNRNLFYAFRQTNLYGAGVD